MLTDPARPRRFRTVSVLGLGLMGGSLLRALADAGHPVKGYDAAPDTRTTAAAAGWQVAETVGEAVAGADLVVLAVPFPAVAGVLDALAAARYPGIVSDVTSVKEPVRALVAERLPRARYVGGHPMAGRETSGFAASDPGLFRGCAWALTLPEPGADPSEMPSLTDWLAVAELLTGIGARVVPVTAAEHDAAVARVSHLPHLAAAAIAAAGGRGLAATLAAGSYRDGTRVAASAPALVAAMCGGNAAAVRPALDQLIADLTEARRHLDTADPIAALREWLRPGHRARAHWPPAPGDPADIPVSERSLLALGRDGGWLTAATPDRHTVTAVRPGRRSPAGRS